MGSEPQCEDKGNDKLTAALLGSCPLFDFSLLHGFQKLNGDTCTLSLFFPYSSLLGSSDFKVHVHPLLMSLEGLVPGSLS